MTLRPGRAYMVKGTGRVVLVGPSKAKADAMIVEGPSGQPMAVPVQALVPCIGDVWLLYDQAQDKVVGLQRTPETADAAAKAKGPDIVVIPFKQSV